MEQGRSQVRRLMSMLNMLAFLASCSCFVSRCTSTQGLDLFLCLQLHGLEPLGV